MSLEATLLTQPMPDRCRASMVLSGVKTSPDLPSATAMPSSCKPLRTAANSSADVSTCSTLTCGFFNARLRDHTGWLEDFVVENMISGG